MIGLVNNVFSNKPYSERTYNTARSTKSRELLDTYNGKGLPYLQKQVDDSFKSSMIKQHMKHLKVCYPIMSRIINKLSKVYMEQPTRRFYINGREIVPKSDEFNTDSIVNEKLCGILKESFYTTENKVKIKDSEKKVNLLNTCVYKVRTESDELKLDYIPNDLCLVEQEDYDNTVAKKLYFISSDTRTEEWTKDNFTITSEDGVLSAENEAGRNMLALGDKSIGSVFAPFVVLRESIPYQDFWNFNRVDFLDNIRQLNMMFTELRYLVRYTSYGLKYAVNVDAPNGADSDPLGFWILNSKDEGMGGSNQFEVGELQNAGKLQEVKDSILFMMSQLLYDMGLSTQDLVATAQKSTAESKELDREDFRQFLKDQQEIWRMNEQNLFKTMRLVWNRDNAYKIPYELEMTVDYTDIDETQIIDDVKRWVVEIENNVSTSIDWIMDKNKDLTRDQAEMILDRNSKINEEYDVNELDSNSDSPGDILVR